MNISFEGKVALVTGAASGLPGRGAGDSTPRTALPTSTTPTVSPDSLLEEGMVVQPDGRAWIVAHQGQQLLIGLVARLTPPRGRIVFIPAGPAIRIAALSAPLRMRLAAKRPGRPRNDAGKSARDYQGGRQRSRRIRPQADDNIVGQGLNRYESVSGRRIDEYIFQHSSCPVEVAETYQSSVVPLANSS